MDSSWAIWDRNDSCLSRYWILGFEVVVGWDTADLGFREGVEVGLYRTLVIDRLEGEAVGDEEKELGFLRMRRSRG